MSGKKVVQTVDQSWNEIETGADDDKNIEIISDLKQGDKIIVNSVLPEDNAKSAALSSPGVGSNPTRAAKS